MLMYQKKNYNIKVCNKYFENVTNSPFFGMTVTNQYNTYYGEVKGKLYSENHP